MNPIIGNIALLTLGTGSLATTVDLASKGNYWGGLLALVVGIVCLYGYEKLPLSTPPPPVPLGGSYTSSPTDRTVV